MDQSCYFLWLTLFNNQNYFDLRADKQLDSKRQQRFSKQPCPSAPWPWPWLPTGVLIMGKLVLLLGNPSKKRLHHPQGWQGHGFGGRQPDTQLPTQLGTGTGLQSLEQSWRPVPLNPPKGCRKMARITTRSPRKMIVLANDNLDQSHWRFYFTPRVKICLCLTLAMVISEYVSSKTVQNETIFTLPDGRHYGVV